MGFEKIGQQSDEPPIVGFEDQTSPEGLEKKMELQRMMTGKIVEGSGMGDEDIPPWLEENGEAMSHLLKEESAFIENFIDNKIDKKDFIKKLDEVKELLKDKTIH